MNTIPSYVADLLVTTFTNMQTNSVVAEQAVTDTYNDSQRRLYKREFILKSIIWDGEIQVNFKLDETTPFFKVRRMDLDQVTDVSVSENVLSITSESAGAVFDIEQEE